MFCHCKYLSISVFRNSDGERPNSKTYKRMVNWSYVSSTEVNFSYRSGPAPRGGIPGPCPPNHCLCPPREDCAPKKLTGPVLLECNSRSEALKILVITPEVVSNNCFFVDFAIKIVCFCGFSSEFMKIRVYFGMKTLFLVFISDFVDVHAFFEMKTFFFLRLYPRFRENLHVF